MIYKESGWSTSWNLITSHLASTNQTLRTSEDLVEEKELGEANRVAARKTWHNEEGTVVRRRPAFIHLGSF